MRHEHRRDMLKQMAAGLACTLTSGIAGTRGDDSGTSRPRIKVGQIGVGHAHASKLAVFRNSPDYEVVGLVEPDRDRRMRADAQESFRGVPWMTQEELLKTPGLQAVLVETEVRDLLNAAEACVAAGKHVHLDKPAGESLPQYRRILDEARKQKLVVQMGYMYRYNPAVVLLRNLLERGCLGEVFEVHAVMSKVVDPSARRGLAEYRGGIMFELGCHILDLVLAILGKPSRVVPFPKHTAPINDGLLDNMLAVLDYPRSTATVKSSALEVDGGARRHLVVCGTEGTLHIQPLDNPSARLVLSRPCEGFRKGSQEIKFPRYIRYVDDAADLARTIRGEKPANFSYEHDLLVQTTLLQASGLPIDR